MVCHFLSLFIVISDHLLRLYYALSYCPVSKKTLEIKMGSGGLLLPPASRPTATNVFARSRPERAEITDLRARAVPLRAVARQQSDSSCAYTLAGSTAETIAFKSGSQRLEAAAAATTVRIGDYADHALFGLLIEFNVEHSVHS
jgi:hypothetical protein